MEKNGSKMGFLDKLYEEYNVYASNDETNCDIYETVTKQLYNIRTKQRIN